MTQQETNATEQVRAKAQAKLFEAARTGDIPAAEAALMAGADLLYAENDEGNSARNIAKHSRNRKMIHFLDTKWDEQWHEEARKTNIGDNRAFAAMLAILLPPLLWLASRAPSIPDLPPDATVSIPDNSAAQFKFRTMLQDSNFTDRLIRQMKDPSFIDAFTTDPKIMQNLQKIAAAIEQDINNMHVGDVEEKPGKDSSTPTNWKDRAGNGQNKAVESPTGRN